MHSSLLKISSLLTALVTVLAANLLPAMPLPLEFVGSLTTADGKENIAFEDWDDHIGRPTRTVTFDDPDLFEITVPGEIAVKAGGDLALLVSPPLLTPSIGGFQGVGNVDDLTEPNVNSLVPGTNMTIAFNFLDRLKDGIPTFGTTEAVGGFVSTLGEVTLEVFDENGHSLGATTKTPESTSPCFLGLIFPDDNGKQPIIARAEFTFTSDGNFDGLVFTSINSIEGEPLPPAPIPEPPPGDGE